MEGARMTAGAVLGLDSRLVKVNGVEYTIPSPTIARLAGACYWLCDIQEANTLRDVIGGMAQLENLARCLSWFIQGDDTLAEELAKAQLSEVMDAIEVAFTLIDVANFIKLSALQRSAATLIVKPK